VAPNLAQRHDGRYLEFLIHQIERILGSAATTVLGPRHHLRDKHTGQRREFDVLVITRDGHSEIRTAVECKDYNPGRPHQKRRKLDVTHIEAFYMKCESCDVHQRVIVSTSGFTEPARKKASALNVRSLDVLQESPSDWVRCERVLINLSCPLTTHTRVDTDPEWVLTDIPVDALQIRSPEGLPISADELVKILKRDEHLEGNTRIASNLVRTTWKMTTDGFSLERNGETVKLVSAERWEISASGPLETPLQPFKLVEKAKNRTIASGAFATFMVSGVRHTLTFIEDEDGTKRVVPSATWGR
jgi:hypothetical protein